MKFLLDTNFMMAPGQTGARIYEQLAGFGRAELYATELSVRELDGIAASRGKDAASARVALLLMKKEGVKVIPAEGRDADEAILKLARHGMIVCTADKALKKRLEKRGILVAYLRQKRYVELDERF